MVVGAGVMGTLGAVGVVVVLIVVLALLTSLVFCLFAVLLGGPPKGVCAPKVSKVPKLYKYLLFFLIIHSNLSICFNFILLGPCSLIFVNKMYTFDDVLFLN